MVVIGGGLSAQHERLLDPLREAVASEIGLPFAVPLVEARLGAEAASHGAVVFAFDRHAEQIYGLPGMPVPSITPLPPEVEVLSAVQGPEARQAPKTAMPMAAMCRMAAMIVQAWKTSWKLNHFGDRRGRLVA